MNSKKSKLVAGLFLLAKISLAPRKGWICLDATPNYTSFLVQFIMPSANCGLVKLLIELNLWVLLLSLS